MLSMSVLQQQRNIKRYSLETAPENELDTGPVKEDDIPPKGVMADEEPPNGVRLWLKFAAPEADVDEGG